MSKDGWNFPDGAALVQTLSREGRRLETRVLLRQQGEWAGYSYAWDGAQTDAELVAREGATHDGWRFPSRQECALCHSRAANFVLGLSTLQLSRGDQLARWEKEGWLRFNHATLAESQWRGELGKRGLGDVAAHHTMQQVLPASGQREPAKDSPLLPRAAAAFPSMPNPHDEHAPLARRARAYLHANCAHCHVRNGGGNSALQLAFDLADSALGLIDATPMHGTLGLPDARLAAPDDPGRSLLLHRCAIRGPGQMPPVGSLTPDASGVALLAEWIASLRTPGGGTH
jgi:mono/diheme cytochrome c family protein